MPHRTVRGRIRYTSRKAGREGETRGDERFTITDHADGARTLRATGYMQTQYELISLEITAGTRR